MTMKELWFQRIQHHAVILYWFTKLPYHDESFIIDPWSFLTALQLPSPFIDSRLSLILGYVNPDTKFSNSNLIQSFLKLHYVSNIFKTIKLPSLLTFLATYT